MKKITTALACVAGLLCASTATAGVYKLAFTATGFDSGSPATEVSGSILFSADSLYPPDTSYFGTDVPIDAIDLTIAGHKYQTNEVAGLYSDGSYWFGGTIGGMNAVNSWDDDFFISSGSYVDFYYSTVDTYVWTAASVTASITEYRAEVPEPGSVALLLAGLAGLGTQVRRRRD